MIFNNLAYADMITKAGNKVTATIVDGHGDGSWPISGYTYIILHQTSMTDCIKARKLLEYFRWTITDASASARAAKRGYAVLPNAVRNQVLSKLGEVTCNGQPVMK